MEALIWTLLATLALSAVTIALIDLSGAFNAGMGTVKSVVALLLAVPMLTVAGVKYWEQRVAEEDADLKLE